MPDRRWTPDSDGTPAPCHECGTEWFELLMDGQAPGRVAVDADGQVVAYAGTLKCAGCGTEHHPVPTGHLRVVRC